MTQLDFNKYIELHKVTKIKPAEFDGHIIYFDNGEWVTVSSGYDGVVYRVGYVGQEKGSSKELFMQLQKIAPSFLEDIKRKYE